MQNEIYNTLVGECEALELSGEYRGKGHLLAERLTVKVMASILPPQEKELYQVATDKWQPTAAFVAATGYLPGTASAILHNIHKRTGLIQKTRRGRKAYWKLHY